MGPGTESLHSGGYGPPKNQTTTSNFGAFGGLRLHGAYRPLRLTMGAQVPVLSQKDHPKQMCLWQGSVAEW